MRFIEVNMMKYYSLQVIVTELSTVYGVNKISVIYFMMPGTNGSLL